MQKFWMALLMGTLVACDGGGGTGGETAETEDTESEELTLENFIDDYVEAFCTFDQSCPDGSVMGYDSVEDCIAGLTEDIEGDTDGGVEECDFNAEAAQECVDGLNSTECEGFLENIPEECQLIFGDGESDTDM